MFSIVVAVLALTPGDGQEEKNPVFARLRQNGVAVSSTKTATLPAPWMPDHLDAREQQAKLKKLADKAEISLEDLTSKAVGARHVLEMRDVETGDRVCRAYAVNLGFIAYGDLAALAKKEDLQAHFTARREDIKVQPLTRSQLADRKLRLPTNRDERYTHSEYLLFRRIRLRVTDHIVQSRTADSLLLAREVDPRFAADKDFPNQWEALDEGTLKPVGKPRPYGGAASYLKITRLHEPEGALFVEFHQVATEPKDWFGGENVIRSKLPLVIPPEVRAFRRDLKKAK